MLTFATNTNFNFVRQSRVALILSAILCLGSVFLLATRGLNFGIDFTGGTVIEVGYSGSVALDEVRETLETGGYGRAVVQYFGTTQDVLIRLAPREGEDVAELSNQVFRVLSANVSGVELRRAEFVGPQVGENLREQGGLAILYALIGILIYIGFRFEWRLSIAAVLGLAHDTLLILGLLSLIRAEFDLVVLAALLAAVGYSLNDTIVVYDRIRENFTKIRKEGVKTIMNIALNQTLSRTIITGATTLLVLLALYLLGGAVLANFSLPLIAGVVIGTYSTIYVASPLALVLGVDRNMLVQVKKKGDEVEEGRP